MAFDAAFVQCCNSQSNPTCTRGGGGGGRREQGFSPLPLLLGAITLHTGKRNNQSRGNFSTEAILELEPSVPVINIQMRKDRKQSAHPGLYKWQNGTKIHTQSLLNATLDALTPILSHLFTLTSPPRRLSPPSYPSPSNLSGLASKPAANSH